MLNGYRCYTHSVIAVAKAVVPYRQCSAVLNSLSSLEQSQPKQ